MEISIQDTVRSNCCYICGGRYSNIELEKLRDANVEHWNTYSEFVCHNCFDDWIKKIDLRY